MSEINAYLYADNQYTYIELIQLTIDKNTPLKQTVFI